MHSALNRREDELQSAVVFGNGNAYLKISVPAAQLIYKCLFTSAFGERDIVGEPVQAAEVSKNWGYLFCSNFVVDKIWATAFCHYLKIFKKI